MRHSQSARRAIDLKTEAITPEAAKPLEELRVFHNVARALTSTLDRDAILRAIMTQMATFFLPQSWSLLLLDEQQKELYFAVVEGRFDNAQQNNQARPLRIPLGEGIAGWVMEHGEPLIVPDAASAFSNDHTGAKTCFSAAERRAISFDVQSVISLPLQSRGRTLGVIQLFNYRLESMNDDALTFLHILADYAAIAIENARAMEQIQQLTITDDCTRLFNTRHLHAALQTEFERARRFNTEFSLIFIDLDCFKQVNDQHGHLVGTELLVEVSRLIQSSTRSVDAVFRYGGDEFVVLLPQTGKAAAVDAAQRLRNALREARFLSGHQEAGSPARDLQLTMTASFGVASYPQDGDSAEAILQAADGLMYSIKHTTRDNVAFA